MSHISSAHRSILTSDFWHESQLRATAQHVPVRPVLQPDSYAAKENNKAFISSTQSDITAITEDLEWTRTCKVDTFPRWLHFSVCVVICFSSSSYLLEQLVVLKQLTFSVNKLRVFLCVYISVREKEWYLSVTCACLLKVMIISQTFPTNFIEQLKCQVKPLLFLWN